MPDETTPTPAGNDPPIEERDASGASATAAPSGGPGAAAAGGGPATAPASSMPGAEGGVAPGSADAGIPAGAHPGPAPGGAVPGPGAAPAPGGGGPDEVPIDPGDKDDLLHPHPGAPGQASRPQGAEAASTGGDGHRPDSAPIHEQHGEQQVSFGGSSQHHPHHDTAPPPHAEAAQAPAAQHAAAPPPPAPEPAAAPPPAHAHHRDHAHHHEHEHHHGTVALDPEGLSEFARAMSRTAAEYGDLAASIRTGESVLPATGELGERLRTARHALERLCEEMEEAARDLEMRAGIIHEVGDTPGVSQAELVSTVFGMKVSPLGDQGAHRRP